MRMQLINVLDVKDVRVPVCESMKELKAFVGDDLDIFYLASRGFDQMRRTRLARLRKDGTSKKDIHRMARFYQYNRRRPALNIPKTP